MKPNNVSINNSMPSMKFIYFFIYILGKGFHFKLVSPRKERYDVKYTEYLVANTLLCVNDEIMEIMNQMIRDTKTKESVMTKDEVALYLKLTKRHIYYGIPLPGTCSLCPKRDPFEKKWENGHFANIMACIKAYVAIDMGPLMSRKRIDEDHIDEGDVLRMIDEVLHDEESKYFDQVVTKAYKLASILVKEVL